MTLNNRQASDFFRKNSELAKEYSKEFTQSFPDLFQKITDPEIKSKEDQLFNSVFITSIENNLINPVIYYRQLHDIAKAFGYSGMFTVLLFTDNFDFVGSANLGYALDYMTVTIQDLFISKRFRRKNYGKLLVDIIIKKVKREKNIRKILLEVDPQNRNAYLLYLKMNFVPITTFTEAKIRMEYWIL